MINVTLIDDAVCNVTGTSLTIEGDTQVIIPEGVVLTVGDTDYTACTTTAEKMK